MILRFFVLGRRGYSRSRIGRLTRRQLCTGTSARKRFSRTGPGEHDQPAPAVLIRDRRSYLRTALSCPTG